MEYVATSMEVARVACRKHSHVLREIDRLRVILPGLEDHLTLADGEKRGFALSPHALAMLDVGTGKSALRWKWTRLLSVISGLEL